MRLKHVQIEGYRCLEKVTIDFDDLTVLLGSNSTGKSSILKALQFFSEGGNLSAEDVFDREEDGRVSVQVTFDRLSDADREVFSVYATGEQMVLRRSWENGATKLTGRGLRYPGFDHIRTLTGADRRKAFQALALSEPELGLALVTTVEAANQDMLRWEMEHPDQCEPDFVDANQLSGYAGVGQAKLANRFKFVFVAGLRDAADETTERKGTILERLLAAIADQRAEAGEGLNEMEERWRQEYEELVEKTHRPTLDGLAERLSDQMRRYVPSAEITLDPVAVPPRIATPQVQLRGGEEQHLTDLGRQGHGFQRTFIIAALEYLAAIQDESDEDRPTLFLAIEEPELYQHPPRAMHFATTLRELAYAEESSVQVCYATHSPYFVTPSDFEAIRICRREAHPDGESPSPTTVIAADFSRVEALMPEGDDKQVRRRLSSTLRSGFGEAFFARAVLLVEGPTDVTVFSHAAHVTSNGLAAHGVVATDVSKSVVPVAHAMLTSLGIPTFVVFDGDYRLDGGEPCATCGRGKRDTANDAGQNRKILEVLGAPVEDFPATQQHARWACFRVDLEDYLTEMIPEFGVKTQAVARELDWKTKSPEVYVETLAQLDGELPKMLTAVPEAVVALIADKAPASDGGDSDRDGGQDGAFQQDA